MVKYLRMKLSYFPDSVARNAAPVLDAFLDSARHHFELVENDLDADAAVIWSVLWNGRLAPNQSIYQHYRNLNRPVIVLEVGSLYRGSTWKVAVNNITAEGYYGHQDNLDWDRPRKLGMSLAHNPAPRPQVIVALQHSKSQQVRSMVSMNDWLQDIVREIRTYTDRPIVIRPHPRDQFQLHSFGLNVSIEQPNPVVNTYDSFDMHFDCHAVVNYNSGVGVQAAISGVRPCVDASSLAAPVGVSIADIEQPYVIDRDQWFVEVCHTEYTLDELRRGTWISRIEPALTVPA